MVVIEHNLDVIQTAGFILDLGPDGGVRGRKDVGKGMSEEVAERYTGQYLKPMLARQKKAAK